MVDRFELFTTTITKIYRCLQKIKTEEMREFNLKGSHVMYLYYLNCYSEGLTLTALSNMCVEDKAATSRNITELIQRKLVTVDPVKKYRAPIMLTVEGKIIADKTKDLINKAVEFGSNGIDDEERLTMYRLLSLISENLTIYLKEEFTDEQI